MTRSILPILCVTFAAFLATRAGSGEPAVTTRWHEHVAYLASDAMRGRQTGSPEHLEAARYVSGQFKALGLEPAGIGGSFLQSVPFAWRRIDEPASSVALVFASHEEPLVLGTDVTIGMSIDEPDSLDAPLVFAGYGISVPEQGYDDLANVDLKDKIVVYLNGGPGSVTEPRRSQAQFAGERWANLRAKGAIGVIGIRNPRRAEGPWEQGAAQRFSPGMSLAEAAVDERQGQRLALFVNSATAEKWFEGSGHTFAEILSLADSGRALPAFDLAARVRAKVRFERRIVTSQNVLASLRGSDPKLAMQFVVLTAHLDHLGVGTPVEGDSIFNGALDNASGVAALIEVARALTASRPKRSVLFAVVTGEEKGLLGSHYWTKRPTVPLGQVVANLNVDMVLPIVPFDHLVVQGVDESTLGDDARAEAAAAAIDVIPDPEPQRNRFIRSDQFNFIRAGIPALAFAAGAVPGSPEDSILQAWRRKHYHEPSDDLGQPIHAAAPAALQDYLTPLTTPVANLPARPTWKVNSFFRTYDRRRTDLARPVAGP
jgi:Zn-dependent M28 family amino/carboxypeptidase